MCVRPKGIPPRPLRFIKRSILQRMSDSWKAPRHLKKTRRSESDDDEQQSKEQEETRGGASEESNLQDTHSNSVQMSSEAARHQTRMDMPQMVQAHLYDPDFQRQQLQQQYQQQHHYQQQQQPPFQHGPWPGMPQTQFPYPYNPYNNQMFQPIYGPSQYFYPQPPMISGPPVVPDQSAGTAAAATMMSPPKMQEGDHRRESTASESAPKRPRSSKDDPSKGSSDLSEAQKAAMRDSKKIIQESMQKNINELSKSSTEQQQREQTVTRSDRKEKKNAQSRARAAKLREKICEVKDKNEKQKTDEEIRLLQIFEDRRRKKNERSRERAIEKKMEIERILAIPESEREQDDRSILGVAMKAKQKKNEGDRIRRERIKSSLVRKKPPGVRGRPRKYPPREPKSKQAKSPAVASTGKSSASSLPSAPQPSESTSTSAHALPTTTTSFAGPQGALMASYGYPSSNTNRRSVLPPDSTQSSSDSMQRALITPSELMQAQQQSMSFESSRLQQQRHPELFGTETSSSTAPEQPNLSMYDMSHLLLYGGTNSEQEEENDDEEKHASI